MLCYIVQLYALLHCSMILQLCYAFVYFALKSESAFNLLDGIDGNDIVLYFQVFSVFVNHVEFRKEIVSGGVLFFFWLLLIFLNIVTFRSNILHITYNQVCLAI